MTAVADETVTARGANIFPRAPITQLRSSAQAPTMATMTAAHTSWPPNMLASTAAIATKRGTKAARSSVVTAEAGWLPPETGGIKTTSSDSLTASARSADSPLIQTREVSTPAEKSSPYFSEAAAMTSPTVSPGMSTREVPAISRRLANKRSLAMRRG